jgi:hypothetical protein
MARVEQAVFTSAETDYGAGYQVVATSRGVDRADRRELATWGPSHDSLLETGANVVSINFFPLPSGAFCVSRTAQVGWEYSGRGGGRVYTQCLVVNSEALRQFANDPLALARAAEAAGAWRIPIRIPSTLEPLEIPGTAPVVDWALLVQLVEQVGPWRVALLVQSVLEAARTIAAAGPAPVEQLIAGLLSCLPLERRTDISFSTGLCHSPRRPFRILPLPSDPAARHRLARHPDVAVLDLAAEASCRRRLTDTWARFVECALSESHIELLADELSQPHAAATVGNLPGQVLNGLPLEH